MDEVNIPLDGVQRSKCPISYKALSRCVICAGGQAGRPDSAGQTRQNESRGNALAQIFNCDRGKKEKDARVDDERGRRKRDDRRLDWFCNLHFNAAKAVNIIHCRYTLLNYGTVNMAMQITRGTTGSRRFEMIFKNVIDSW